MSSSPPPPPGSIRPQPSRASSRHCTAAIATAEVLPGFWRPGPNASKAYPCGKNDDQTSCAGGAVAGTLGGGYCVDANHTGALCEACVQPRHHFDGGLARCAPCPETGGSVTLAAGVVLFVIAGAALCARAVQRPPLRSMERGAALVRHMAHTLVAHGLLPKAKIAFTFTQMVYIVPTLFEVTLPPGCSEVWEALSFIELDWLAVAAPPACYGDFEHRLLIMGLAPIALISVVLVGCVAWSLGVSRGVTLSVPATAGLVRGLPIALLLSFVLVPPVSKYIFSSFDCIQYDVDSSAGLTTSFLRADASVICQDSVEHQRIFTSALTLSIVWPCGAPILYVALLWAAQKAIQERKPNRLTRACAFLHTDYQITYFYWEPLDLVRRIVLTGGLLLIPDRVVTLRLIVALLVSLFFCVALLSCVPFKRHDDNILAVAAAFVLTCIYLGALLVKLHADNESMFMEFVGATLTSGDVSETVSSTFSFENTEALVIVMLVFIFLVLGFVLAALLQRLVAQSAVQTLRLASGSVPELTLHDGHVWQLFLSHVWGSGQVCSHTPYFCRLPPRLPQRHASCPLPLSTPSRIRWQSSNGD